MIHPWVVRQIEWFLAQRQAGSITFDSDGQALRKVEFRLFKKREAHEQEEKEKQAHPHILNYTF